MKNNLFSSKRPDYFYISILVILVIFGLVMLASASSDLAKKETGDSYYYLKHQIINGLLVGLAGFFLTFFINYRFWKKMAFILFILNIFSLILVFTSLGMDAKGASRWISIGNITFQPSEFLKLTLLLFLATWMGGGKGKKETTKGGLLPFLFFLGGSLFLVILQPSTTNAIIIGISALIMYFIAGAKYRLISATIILFIVSFAVLILLTPYRLNRIKSFLFPTQQDEQVLIYQSTQARLAIGAGGLTGVGFGQSTVKSNLPEPLADSIFAIIGEEFGFIGSFCLVVIFFLLILKGLIIAKKAPDNFGRLLAIGFTSVIGIQAFTNIGAVSGLIPLTGVPLPFISYGGTALAIFLTMGGIIANISKYAKK